MDEKRAQPRVTVHMIGNAHIDPVWLWTLSEGRAEVLSTYRTAIALIEAYDGYIFTSGGAVTYLWAAEDDPVLFEAIRQAVARGRWALVNGWWLQPDCNIPSGESFARHALYGQRYLQSRFGRRARVGYNVDSFGHAGTLPQLLKLAGLDYYVFFRPDPREKELPKGPFWWEAPDGTRVLACRPPLHYGSPGDVDMAQRIQAAAQGAPDGFPVVMCFYGVGNHGGGPTRRSIQAILDAMHSDIAARPIFSSPQHFFEQAAQHTPTWPVVRDELQHHSRGCYTALSRVKRENRLAEHALARAERFAALAHVLCGTPNQQEALREAWQGVLFNQFHDILAGTCIRDGYKEVWSAYEAAQCAATRVQEVALQALGARINVADRASASLIWNPSPWERTDNVRLSMRLGGWRHDFEGRRYPGQPVVVDNDGQPIACQLVGVELDYNTYIAHLEARLTVPALGARVLYVTLPETAPPSRDPQPVYADTLENGIYRVRIDPDSGWLTGIRDLEHDCEFLAGPANVPLILDDPSDTWSHDVSSFRDVVGRFVALGPAELVHQGPVCRTLRVRMGWGDSRIVQDITLYPGARAIDVTMTVDWHEQHKMLKIAFPLALQNAHVTASAPYGHIARRANGEEEPCQAWVDLGGQMRAGQGGLCLVNDSKYGYDALDNELRLSILRSPIYAFHRPRRVFLGVTYHYTDQGAQVVRYRLLPHLGPWQTVNPARHDQELHEPLIAQPVNPHRGTWQEGSLLRVAPEGVVLTTLKVGEDGERLIARGYETIGEAAQINITSDILGCRWSYNCRPHEIWTLALPLQGGDAIPLNLLEEPLG